MSEYDREHFYTELLVAIDAPHTNENLLALRAWGECEGSDAMYNPLDTTQPEPGDNPYNSFTLDNGTTLHVWNYPNEQEGVKATADTLHNGHYPHILGELKAGTGRVCFGAAADEMHTWGTLPECVAGKLKGTSVTETPENTQPAPPHVTHEPPVNVPPDVPFDHTMRDWMHRVLRHLQGRDNPLPGPDHQLLQQLTDEAKRVARLGK